MRAIRPRSNDFVICAALSLEAYTIAKADLIALPRSWQCDGH